MDSLAAWINIALGILTIVAASGAGLSIAYMRELRARVQDLRGEIADKDRRLSQAESDVKDGRAKSQVQDTEIKALQRIVTGDEKLTLIRTEGIRHHNAATEHWREEEAILRKILVALERERG